MTDREAFEAWHDDKNMPYPNGHECPHRYWEWQAWQAALASERAKQAEPVALHIDHITPDDRKRYYDFEKYADHLPTCKQPRGDQSCECGYSAVRTNLSDLLDELSAPAQQEPKYVLASERAKQQQEADDQTKWASHYARQSSNLFDTLQALEQAYSNPHSPQHRAACLAEARTVLAAFDQPSERAKQAEPVPFNAPGKAHVEAMLGSAAPPAAQAEPVALDRWGIKSVPGRPEDYWFEKMPDGYWTPWHLANEALQLAAPPADDEAVRLLIEARKHVTASEIDCSSCADVDRHKAIVKASGGQCNPYGCCADLGKAIDAYLAKVKR